MENKPSNNVNKQICDQSIELGFYVESGDVKAVENALNKFEYASVIVNTSFGPLSITSLQLAAAKSDEKEARSLVQLLIKHGAKVQQIRLQYISFILVQTN